MKTLIAYCTNHGCTEKTAREIEEFLGKQAQLVNLKQHPYPSVHGYDRVIIGGSIHAGQIQKQVKLFCNKYQNELINKELGLFICCMEEGEKARVQFNDAFPENLRKNAKANACLGGELNFAKMNFIQKVIIKKVAQINESQSKVDHKAIQTFSKKMDKIFNPFLFLA